MATMKELAERLRKSNPENKPMTLQHMATIFWPDAEWLNSTAFRHNGGLRKGGLAAAGLAGRMAKKGLLKKPVGWIGITVYVLA